MDSVREIVASSTFELGTTGIPNKGSQNVSITSIADLGKGKIAFAGYTRGYLRNKNFQGFSPDFASFSGKKFVGMLENKDQIKWLNYIDELVHVDDYNIEKKAFVKKANESSFYVLGDRSVILTGDQVSYNNSENVLSTYVAKYDSSGNEIWKIDNNAFNGADEADWQYGNKSARSSRSLVVTEDDALLTVEMMLDGSGHTKLTSLNQEGKMLWEKTILTGNTNEGEAASDKDGNYYLTGSTKISLEKELNKNHGEYDGYIMKLDSSGNIKWSLHIGNYSDDKISDVTVDQQGNIYVVGSARYDSETLFGEKITETWQAFVAKLSSDGDILWGHLVPKIFSFANWNSDISLDEEGNVLISASDYSDNDIHIAKYSSSGKRIDHIEFSVNDVSYPKDYKISSDGFVYVSGGARERNSRRSKGFIAKVDINSSSVTEEFIPASGSCGSISIKNSGGLEGLNTEVSCSNAVNPVNNITNKLTSITNNVYNITNNNTTANISNTGSGNINVGDIGTVNNTTTIDNSFTIQTTDINLSLAISGDSKKSEKVEGTDGNDLIADGRGKDKLIGGGGADQFYFAGEEPFKKKTVDKVIDFDASEGDVIVIADEVFGDLADDTTLAIADTKRNLKQLSKDGYDLLYFEPKGDLYVDGNGDSKGFGKKSEGGMIADLPNDTVLTESDVLIGV